MSTRGSVIAKGALAATLDPAGLTDVITVLGLALVARRMTPEQVESVLGVLRRIATEPTAEEKQIAENVREAADALLLLSLVGPASEAVS